MRRTHLGIVGLIVGALLAACGGGSGGGGTDGGNTPPPDRSEVVVLAANDLGMHCMDREFSVFSILPPFNVVNAQVVGHTADGRPLLLDQTDIDVRYDAVADGSGSSNASSVGKTDFWAYAESLFGMALNPGEGLTGRYMPQDAPRQGAQPMDYFLDDEWFSAEGIPITPLDDARNVNPYPLMRISAHAREDGSRLGYLDVVLPVATETECRTCHVSGKVGASREDVVWSTHADTEVQSKENILRLHDALESTTLAASTPVLCAQCHYSRALDLNGAGPNAQQAGRPAFSGAMHNYHGKLTAADQPLLPDNIASCYECHPGRETQCQRGAMQTGGMDCIDCHGGMLAVGAEYPLQAGGSIDGAHDGQPRRPWFDLPRCQSCHTGDAVTYLDSGAGLAPDDAYPFRLRQAYRSGDPSASPLLAANDRFAENSGTLYRFSRGHGGIFCQGCHGSTHAEWPIADPAANDNAAAVRLQGYAGKIIECSVCHAPGSLPLTTDGPHGLHNVNDARWVDENHGDFFKRDPNGCRACHGTDLLGTPLAQVAANRSFKVEDATVAMAKDERVRCNRCHGMPD